MPAATIAAPVRQAGLMNERGQDREPPRWLLWLFAALPRLEAVAGVVLLLGFAALVIAVAFGYEVNQ